MRNSYGDLIDHQGRPIASTPLQHPSRVNKWSKRDYESFARVLKDTKPMTTVDNKDPANLAWAAVVQAMAELFHEDNSRFDMLRFVRALHEHEQLSLDVASPPTQRTDV